MSWDDYIDHHLGVTYTEEAYCRHVDERISRVVLWMLALVIVLAAWAIASV